MSPTDATGPGASSADLPHRAGSATDDGHPPSPAALAREVWRVSRELAGWQMQYFDQLLGRFGLSTNDSATLVALEPGSTYSMGQVAQLWSCDASTTTWVAKRLEAKRLVTRRAGSDRRVRELTLTPLGEKTRARLIEAIETPPSTLDAWPRADLVQVRDALERFSAAIGLDESRKTDRTRRRTS